LAEIKAISIFLKLKAAKRPRFLAYRVL